MRSMTVAAEAEARPPRDLAALGAALVTVVFWASAFVGIRSAGQDFSPGALSLGRLLVAQPCSARSSSCAASGCRARATCARSAAAPLCGLLWFGAYNVALNSGERRVDAGTAAMLVNIGPILIAVIAGLVLREGFPRRSSRAAPSRSRGVAIIARRELEPLRDDDRRAPLLRSRGRRMRRRRRAEGRAARGSRRCRRSSSAA